MPVTSSMRRVTPALDGAPVSETFRVSPNRDVPTVYTVEIPAAADELVAENNARAIPWLTKSRDAIDFP